MKISKESKFATGVRVTTHERPREKHMLKSEEFHARLDLDRKSVV